MSGRIAGVCYVRVDGRQYDLRGSLIVSISPTERSGVAGQDGVHGFIEMPRVPFISGVFSDTANLSVAELDAIEGATITAELANGKAYILRDAWTKSAHEIDTAQGQVAVRFEGLSGDELL